jgi:hypothetical protein
MWPLNTPPVLPDGAGDFGTARSTDIHTGVDLYCPLGSEVRAIEDGVIVGIEAFTGAWVPGTDASPWWNDTAAILVRGPSGIIVYGEVEPPPSPADLIGRKVTAGEFIGRVRPVLRTFKGRPMVMLHLELLAALPEGYTGLYLREGDVSATCWWHLGDPKPDRLLDPRHLLADAPRFDLAAYNGEDFADPAAPRKASPYWAVWGGTP